VHELQRIHIGKESNRLEDVDAGDVHDLDEVLTSYGDPGTDAFTLWVKPVVDKIPASAIAHACGFSVSYAHRLKSGRAPMPSATASRKRLALTAAAELGLRANTVSNINELYGLIATASACSEPGGLAGAQENERAANCSERPIRTPSSSAGLPAD